MSAAIYLHPTVASNWTEIQLVERRTGLSAKWRGDIACLLPREDDDNFDFSDYTGDNGGRAA